MADIRSRLFGRIALDTKLVTLDQIQECLNLQVEYEKAGKKIPRLGELLAAKGFLSADQVRNLLQQQRDAAKENVQERGPDPVQEAKRESQELPAAQALSAPASSQEKEKSHSDSDTSDRPEQGETFGKFRILKRLGADSSGYTYKAKYEPRDLTVILRVLSRKKMEDKPDYVRAFEEKIRKATELKHPGIQHVVAAGRLHGRDYYAAEYVEGISLKRILEARGKLDTPFALDIANQIVTALCYGHEHGVLHLEIRPSNILITPEHTVKLVAYGVAHDIIGNLEKIAESTGESPFYIAPEQAVLDEEHTCVDVRTDLYSLGAVLYHALTGQPPFKGDSVREVLLNLAEEDVADPTLLNPDIPRKFADIILSMMNPEPDMRYQNAEQLRAHLHGIAPKGLKKTKAVLPVDSGLAALSAEDRKTTGSTVMDSRKFHGSTRRTATVPGAKGNGSEKRGRGRNSSQARGRPSKKDNTATTMIIGGFIMLVALIGIILVALNRNNQPDPQQNKPVPQPVVTVTEAQPQEPTPEPATATPEEPPIPKPAPAPAQPVAVPKQPAPAPKKEEPTDEGDPADRPVRRLPFGMSADE